MDGIKHDKGKPDWSLLPFESLAQAAEVFTFGAQKYARHNWRDIVEWRDRIFAALMRHLSAWFTGERNDPETGKHHLAHALCCVMMLLARDTAACGADVRKHPEAQACFATDWGGSEVCTGLLGHPGPHTFAAPCDKAPHGWHCMRGKGHDGPCAARGR